MKSLIALCGFASSFFFFFLTVVAVSVLCLKMPSDITENTGIVGFGKVREASRMILCVKNPYLLLRC